MSTVSDDLVVDIPRSRIAVSSMVGTTVEFYDFYVYATAAVSVFPQLFFPRSSPTTALLASLATFGLAFGARPVGSMLFGHFGDRVGRKATLVASLLVMGTGTFAIGVLPPCWPKNPPDPPAAGGWRCGRNSVRHWASCWPTWCS